MTDVEYLILDETLKRSFEVVEYRINSLGEEKTYYYKQSKKKFLQYINEEGLKVRRVDNFPDNVEENFCYIASSGKLVWMKVKVK